MSKFKFLPSDQISRTLINLQCITMTKNQNKNTIVILRKFQMCREKIPTVFGFCLTKYSSKIAQNEERGINMMNVY